MSTPTPRTDEARRIDNGDTRPLLDEMETLERELATERQKVRALREALRRIEDAAYKHSFDGDVLAWAGDVATDALAIAATKEGAK